VSVPSVVLRERLAISKHIGVATSRSEEEKGIVSSSSEESGWASLMNSLFGGFFIAHTVLWGALILRVRPKESLCVSLSILHIHFISRVDHQTNHQEDSPFFQSVVDYSVAAGYVLVSILGLGGLLFLIALVGFFIDSRRKRLAEQTSV